MWYSGGSFFFRGLFCLVGQSTWLTARRLPPAFCSWMIAEKIDARGIAPGCRLDKIVRPLK